MSAQCIPEYLIAPSPNYKWCPRCTTGLPIDEFGISRTRSDGRNIYCKPCNRDKTNASREALREGRREREASKLAPKPIPAIVEPRTPMGIVRQALRNGSRTITEIRHKTGMLEDHIDGILATLVLVRHEVEIYDVKIEVSSDVKVGDGTGDYIEEARMYRLRTA